MQEIIQSTEPDERLAQHQERSLLRLGLVFVLGHEIAKDLGGDMDAGPRRQSGDRQVYRFFSRASFAPVDF